MEFYIGRVPMVGRILWEDGTLNKNTLKKVVGVSSLDFEQLNNVLVEIENVKSSRPLTYMNDENLDESLTPYHLIYGRNIATNEMSLIKMATDSESLRLSCKKINLVLKTFCKTIY